MLSDYEAAELFTRLRMGCADAALQVIKKAVQLIKVRLKDLINEALRRGLKDMTDRPKHRKPFRTQSVALGAVRMAGIDNIGEALALAESEAFK
jgi:hypothetical protein